MKKLSRRSSACVRKCKIAKSPDEKQILYILFIKHLFKTDNVGIMLSLNYYTPECSSSEKPWTGILGVLNPD